MNRKMTALALAGKCGGFGASGFGEPWGLSPRSSSPRSSDASARPPSPTAQSRKKCRRVRARVRMSRSRRKVLIIIYSGRTRDFFKKIFWEKTHPAATIAGAILPPPDPGCPTSHMMRPLVSIVILLALASAAFGEGENLVDFQRDVRPILSNRCFKCHGPAHQEGGARLDQREAALKRKRIVPGNPDAS